MRRQRSRMIVAGLLVVVVAAGVYLLGINPIFNHIHKGLDLQGGLEVIYQAEPTAQEPLTPTAMQQTVSVIRYRVDSLGVTEPVIQQDGTDRIIVQLPGIKNPENAIKVIGTTANLEFKTSTGGVVVTGAHLKSASAEIQQGYGNVVVLQFDSAGTAAISKYTSANVGKTMPIYIDNKQVMNPTVQSAITNGTALLTGGFPTLADAQNLAIELNSGALPIPLKIIENQTVSASLGATSVAASLKAAIIAAALVVAFMMLLYRIPGFWADVALAVYAMLLLAALWAVNATLTLPGITGIILSIGMAVDANVIIYERIREELRGGRTLRSSVDAGFSHGLRAVVDSNATAVIACAVLFWLGSGPIRGFAVTLGIGVIISMLTAVLFTRYLLHRLVDAGAQPSVWFFAPRAEVATAAAAAGAAMGPGRGGAPLSSGRGPDLLGRAVLSGLRRSPGSGGGRPGIGATAWSPDDASARPPAAPEAGAGGGAPQEASSDAAPVDGLAAAAAGPAVAGGVAPGSEGSAEAAAAGGSAPTGGTGAAGRPKGGKSGRGGSHGRRSGGKRSARGGGRGK